MTDGVANWRLCPHDSVDRSTLLCSRCGSKVEIFVPPDSFTVTPPDPFALLQKYAEEFDLRRVSRMIRLAAPESPLYGATFSYTTAGGWSFKARPGVAPERAALELCRLLGIVQ